ncbi:hypothetical protein [Pedobacter faecalis]|uniref:hypothetical protein n=1 Tax=Pedobacter faecalis TaxID=3041495 RepID=UPI002549DB66|nr:hypothetical protein [Pedobacter sp. ELA7]
MVHQKPHFYGRTVSEFYNTHDFSEFNVIRSPVGHPHIIPKNPNPGAEDGFELFRQSMTAVTHMAGSWPDIDVAPREHVEFRWVEHIDCYPETDRITGSVIWKDRLDVKLCAFYVGPINIIGIKPIDVNAVFAVPEIFLTP